MYPNCLLHIVTIYLKCFLFEFFGCDIYIHIPILTGFQNGWIIRKKNNIFLLKNIFLKLIFRDECRLYARIFICILTIYCKCFLLQLLGCGIPMHIPILKGVQNGCISPRKNSNIFIKHFLFEALFLR